MGSNEGGVKPAQSCGCDGYIAKMFGGGEKAQSEKCPGGCGQDKCNCNCDLKNHLKDCCGYGQRPPPATCQAQKNCSPPPQASSSSCNCGSLQVNMDAAPTYNPKGVCCRKEKLNEGCPPMPCSDLSGCTPAWFCNPPPLKHSLKKYPAPPGENIAPISVGGRHQVGPSASEKIVFSPSAPVKPRACVSRPQAMGELPIQLLPLNLGIPPIPRSHDQPDCLIRMRNSKPAIQKIVGIVEVVEEPKVEISNNSTNNSVANYCEAVESLCSAVEGLLQRVSSRQSIPASAQFKRASRIRHANNNDDGEPAIIDLAEINQSIQRLKRSRSRFANNDIRHDANGNQAFKKNHDGGTLSSNNNKSPRWNSDLRSADHKRSFLYNSQPEIPKKNFENTAKVIPSAVPRRTRTDFNISSEIPRCSPVGDKSRPKTMPNFASPYRPKHLTEIPTPTNPFLSMKWQGNAGGVNARNQQLNQFGRSRSLSSGTTRPKSNGIAVASHQKRPASISTQTFQTFEGGFLDDLATCGGESAKVGNKDCPATRPRCPSLEKKEESPGFFAKIRSFFGGSSK